MALIVHLSDLHLGVLKDDQVMGDYKDELVPLADREQRIKALGAAVRSLGEQLEASKEGLDAVVVTGDVSYATDIEGFRQLEGILSPLERLCRRDRILVLPGNHDVKWDTDFNSADRYENFRSHVRDAGYRTPIIERLDVRADGTVTDLGSHSVVDSSFRWAIIPFNTTNYCGIRDSATERLIDMPRISPEQFTYVRSIVDLINKKAQDAGHDARHMLKIAAIHHQILPVSTSEELKPYESIINLGKLRQFLSQLKFNIVLHGHKHTSVVYYDHIYDIENLKRGNPHRVLIVSAGTIGMGSSAAQEVGRLLRIDAQPYAPSVEVESLRAITSGGRLTNDEKHFRLWENPERRAPGEAGVTIISGETVDETYARIQSTLGDYGPSQRFTNVVCHINSSAGAQNIPTDYPELPADYNYKGRRDEWFSDLVQWWQREKSAFVDREHFNHGTRIHSSYEGNTQFRRSANVLASDDDTSRAIITLINPNADFVDESEHRFPSFCLVQFIVVRSGGAPPRLDCVGYFRKQEMGYWWPVNVGELALLQERMLKEVKDCVHGLEPGSLTTVAAVAVMQADIPKVAVPLVDRYLDENKSLLWDSVYALFNQNVEERSKYEGLWDELLTSLCPPGGRSTEAPVATKGLEYLAEIAEPFCRHHAGRPVARIVDDLKELASINRHYEKDSRETRDQQGIYEDWRKRATPVVGRIRSLVTEALQSPTKAGN